MAIKANLVIDQGSDFVVDIDLSTADGDVFNLTGYIINSEMRKNYASSTSVAFTTSHNGVGGRAVLSLSNAETAEIEPGRYLYDVEIVSPLGIKTRVVEGIATVTPSMTRI